MHAGGILFKEILSILGILEQQIRHKCSVKESEILVNDILNIDIA